MPSNFAPKEPEIQRKKKGTRSKKISRKRKREKTGRIGGKRVIPIGLGGKEKK